MSGTDAAGDPAEASREELLTRLERLQETVDDTEEQEQVEAAMRVAKHVPGSSFVTERIRKYTTRDVAEGFVGGFLIAMPMLVEGGVFEIAEWFASETISGVPVYFLANVGFTLLLTIGLLYWTDIREVSVTNPILGFIPRRLVGVLSVTLLSSAALVFLWGRHQVGDPTQFEVLARISVVWTAAAFGGALGDILPGESKGYDIQLENLDDIVGPD